jgi:hypothetical protein
MGRKILLVVQICATLLFISTFQANAGQNIWSWTVPLTILLLIIINSVWFTRFVSWLIFSLAFFALLTVLSAFTLRWRLEPAFSSGPFYRAMLMYTLFVYISLGQIKIIGGAKRESTPPN